MSSTQNGNGVPKSGSANGGGTPPEVKTPFLIGVAGGTASGKSTVCNRIMEQLGQADMDHAQRQVVCISQDSFYRELSAAEKSKADKGLFNFDHPDAFNEPQMLAVLKQILDGQKVTIHSYDYKANALCPEKAVTIYPADVVLFEGILVFYFQSIRDLFHMKLFVDTDSDTRLARRVPRDINERGRDLDQVLTQYMTFVKPAFDEFCSPTKKFADVIIPRGADNTVAIELIVQHIRDFLNNRTRGDTESNAAFLLDTSSSSSSGGGLGSNGGSTTANKGPNASNSANSNSANHNTNNNNNNTFRGVRRFSALSKDISEHNNNLFFKTIAKSGAAKHGQAQLSILED